MTPVNNNGPRPVSTPRPESPPVQAAPQSAPAPAETKAAPKPPPDNFVRDRNTEAFNSSARNEIKHFAKSAKADVATNKDGSVTRSSSNTSRDTTRTKELTTNKGLLGDTKLKYATTSTTPNKEGKNEVKNTYTSQSDIFGRTTAAKAREAITTKGDTSETKSTTEATDRWGNKKTTKGEATATTEGNTTTSESTATTTDARGNESVVTENKTVTKDGKTSVTRSTKETTGTERNTNSTAEFKGGTYTVGESLDFKNNKFNKQTSITKEKELSPSTADKGFSQAEKNDKLSYAQKAGDVAGAMGAKKELSKDKFEKIVENDSTPDDPNTFRGTRTGTSGSHNVTAGADGLNGSYNREAKTGRYAETSDKKTGQYGEASYNAAAKLEAKATVDGKGKLDLNGLDASGSAKMGVSAETSVSGKAQTKSTKVAGVDVNASIEGNARFKGEVAAEATGKVKITRNPPTAVAEGTLGASAVTKLEGDVKLSAGPFALKASAYGSAGAELKATGVLGYENGKVKIGGSAGAALGLGGGGAAQVEVDVKQIGQMAKNTADVNKDGKLGFDDAAAAAINVKNAAVDTARNTVNAARDTVNAAKNKVASWFGW